MQTNGCSFSHSSEQGLLPIFLAFQMKDVDVFLKNMFGDMVMEKMTGLKYWRIMKTKVMNGKQKFRS
jgi:hypothetical protein